MAESVEDYDARILAATEEHTCTCSSSVVTVRVGQFRGSPLLDWEENLPKVPDEVAAENARFVAERLVAAYGGRAHPAPVPE